MRHPWKKLFNIKCLSPLRGVQDPGIQYEPPVFGRTTSTQEMVLPATSDLLWMEGALAGLVAYVATPLERTPGLKFEETSRYFRGRMLAALRDLAADQLQSLAQVGQELQSRGVAEPPVGWDTIGDSLARDGLAVIEREAGETRIGLPA